MEAVNLEAVNFERYQIGMQTLFSCLIITISKFRVEHTKVCGEK